MLVKATDTWLTAISYIGDIVAEWSVSAWITSNDIYYNSSKYQWSLGISITIYSNYVWSSQKWYIYKNWTSLHSYTFSSSGDNPKTYSSDSFNPTDKYSFKLDSWASWKMDYTITIRSGWRRLPKWGSKAKSKFDKIVWLWEFLVWGAFFGVLNWEMYMWEEKTIATTGSITPWNFVWYIQIWKYKIPYYL